MKALKTYTLLSSMVIFTSALLSWDHANNSKTESNAPLRLYSQDKNFQWLTEADIASYMADNGWYFSPQPDVIHPTAEDVLIQRIPGDNNHLLMMAYYSKENYSGQFVTIENGSTLVFRDDGTGYDKKAGDGFYTAKIAADVKEFRQQALSMLKEMKKNSYKPIRFVHRTIVVDPDAKESFDIQKFDRNEAVSIYGLTNALSDLDPSTDAPSDPEPLTNALSSGISTNTVSVQVSLITTHCVTITDTAVVEDLTRTWNSCRQIGNVDGPWTFKTIMKQLTSKDPSHTATDAEVSDFVKKWLNLWATDQIINEDTVKARSAAATKILNPWLNKSKNAGAPVGQLDMRFAPFKLLAIVNRFDLRQGGVHGIPGSSVGEGRYVFGLVNPACSTALKMGVILEYGVHKPNTCDARKAWAQQWLALKDLAIGSSQYNQALQNITDQYTLSGSDSSKPNQSALDQLRTNEIALSPTPAIWEMREFVLDGTTGLLKENTVAQNPADKYNAQVINADVQRMVSFVNQNTVAIKRDTFTVPLTWQGSPFLGGAAKISAPPTGQPPNAFHWDGTEDGNVSTFIKNNVARFNFSLNTCWGCHGGETQTGFTHVDPVFYGKEASLSGFLTGRRDTVQAKAIDFDFNDNNDSMTVKDPALRPSASPATRIFNDILRRARDLKSVASTTCGSVLSISSELMFKPLNSVD